MAIPHHYELTDVQWNRGAFYWENFSQNDFTHLIGSERNETYQTYKWVTPTYPKP